MNSKGIVPGVYAASITPFTGDYQVNHSLLVAHCRWLIDHGCQGICLAGTTGEANSLSLDERKLLLENVLEGGIDPKAILLGVGCCSLPDTIALANHGIQLGVGGLLVLPPFFYTPVTNQGLLCYFSRLMDAVGQTDASIYLYHIPRLTGIPLTIDFIHELLNKYPKAITGLKDSSNDWTHILSMIREFPELDVFCGSEQFLSDTLKEGGKGCIAATVNLTASMAGEVFRKFHQGAPGNEQEKLNEIRGIFEKAPMIAGVKFVKGVLDNEPGWSKMRAPLSELSEEHKRELEPLIALSAIS